MRFKKSDLLARDLPYSAIESTIVGHTRWSVKHDIVFEHDGKYYQARYSTGATELQDEGPWDYEDEVECTEVKPVEKLVRIWEKV